MTATASPSKRYPRGTILGSYRLDDVLGVGGMGIVYTATHTRLDRRVAIKVLRSEFTTDLPALRRFFGEARAVNQIAHPNIIEITDFVERPGEDNYYVMELLEGVSLAELVETGGMLTLPRAVAIMTQLAEALAAVHHAGIIHRDVKPQNVMLIDRAGQSDFVKLVDFGAAKLQGVQEDAGQVVATRKYMSPEHAAGTPVDHRTDIYSFGVTLYEAVTGQLPVDTTDPTAVATVAPTPPRQLAGLPHEIPQDLEALILACLAKDPTDRPPTIDIVVEELVAIAEHNAWLVYELTAVTALRHSRPSGALQRAQTPAPVPAPAPAPAPAPVRSRRRLWIAIASAVVAVVAIVIVQLATARPTTPERPAGPSVATRVTAELAIADDRIAAGRFVAAGGDDALAHLQAARSLDPKHPGVRERLRMIARKYEDLAAQAFAADSLAEAASHLQTVLAAEPDNAAAAARLKEIEDRMLIQQRAKR